MLSEAVRGEAVVLGRSYYDFFLRAFGLPLLLLMGIGPLIAWRRASLKSLATTFRWPTVVALATGVVLLAPRCRELDSGPRRVHVLGVRARDDRDGVRARDARAQGARRGARGRARSRRSSRATAAATAATSSTRRSCCFAIGVAGSSAFDSRRGGEARERASRCGSATTRSSTGRSTSGERRTRRRSARRSTSGAAIVISARSQAGKNAYTIEQQVSNEVGIRSDRLTGEDLFVIAEQIDPDGSIYFRVFVKPLVNLIWLAGLVFLLGSLITLWPDRREQRRLVARASEVGLPATR